MRPYAIVRRKLARFGHGIYDCGVPTISRSADDIVGASISGMIEPMFLSSSFFARVLTPLNREVSPRQMRQIQFACLLVTLVIGATDYLAGRDITLAFVYALPISVVSWYAGRFSGLLLAVLSVVLSVGGDIVLQLYSGVLITTINCVCRLSFYGLLALAMARLGRLQRDVERRAEHRALALARETAERTRLEQEMIEISEREQRRIGRDLHDGLCQHLTGTAMAGQVLVETLSGAQRPEAAQARKLVRLVEDAVTAARGMAKGLHPVEMEADGLMRALEEFAATTSELFGVQCRFLCHVPVLIRAPMTAIHLYRIAQEAVSNAIKHGRARQVFVLLDETEAGIRLVISDDGSGFSDRPNNGGMGLRIMADRAKMIGGEFSISRNGDGGMELTCWSPTSAVGLEAADA